MTGAVVKKRRLYFTMVFAPKGWQRAGNAYATKQMREPLRLLSVVHGGVCGSLSLNAR